LRSRTITQGASILQLQNRKEVFVCQESSTRASEEAKKAKEAVKIARKVLEDAEKELSDLNRKHIITRKRQREADDDSERTSKRFKFITEKCDEDKKDEPEKCCSICLDTFRQKSSIQCGHLFCYSCILRCKEKCPKCRQPFSVNGIHKLFE